MHSSEITRVGGAIDLAPQAPTVHADPLTFIERALVKPVSYTHLTLPTIYSV